MAKQGVLQFWVVHDSLGLSFTDVDRTATREEPLPTPYTTICGCGYWPTAHLACVERCRTNDEQTGGQPVPRMMTSCMGCVVPPCAGSLARPKRAPFVLGNLVSMLCLPCSFFFQGKRQDQRFAPHAALSGGVLPARGSAGCQDVCVHDISLGTEASSTASWSTMLHRRQEYLVALDAAS